MLEEDKAHRAAQKINTVLNITVKSGSPNKVLRDMFAGMATLIKQSISRSTQNNISFGSSECIRESMTIEIISYLKTFRRLLPFHDLKKETHEL
jgi:hypothetical protein